MLIKIGYEFIFDCPTAVPMTLMLRVHPSRQADILSESWGVEPQVPVQEFLDGFGNRCERIVAPAGPLRLWGEGVVQDSGLPDQISLYARQVAVEELPPETLPYLLNSRYCQVDLLNNIAWELFGYTTPGWSRVQAICDWVHNHITFGYPFARPTKSALDVYLERTGVCRDFTHLAIAFCRCLNIPARYTTGYLGDIGIPPPDAPMDFSGWFEVYLEDEWHTGDARFNTPRIGRIVMARGRDATDVALTTAFGVANLQKMTVVTDEVVDGP